MLKWLAIAAAMLFFLWSPASAQLKGLSPAEVAGVARTRALDLRIVEQRQAPRPESLVRGMIVSREVAPNATLGVGLASIYGRKRAGGELRINGGPGRSRKPAVTFVLRF